MLRLLSTYSNGLLTDMSNIEINANGEETARRGRTLRDYLIRTLEASQ